MLSFWLIPLITDAIAFAQSTGDVRLRGGSTSNQGRVEIYYNGQWGTVCDDFWGLADARVVCYQLGYSYALSSKKRSYFGKGSGPVWMDDVTCNGSESSLQYCSFRGWGMNDCINHTEDAGVICSSLLLGSSIAGNGDIRLVGGSSSLEGRVEIYYSGEWSTVCDGEFSDVDAQVVCRQLGLSRSNAKARSGALYGQVNGTVLAASIKCQGTEFRLSYCFHNDWRIENCGHNQYVGVSCDSPDSMEFPQDGDIRLLNGPSSIEGRVEIYHNGLWGTVCDNRFSGSDAKVVCRQLGYSTSNAKVLGGAYYGPGGGPVWLDEVTCSGSESRLSYCTHSGWRNTDCYHSEDAGVVCRSDENTGVVIAVGVTVTFVVIVIIVSVVIVVCHRRRVRRLASMTTTYSGASQTGVCQVSVGEIQPETTVRYSSLAQPDPSFGAHGDGPPSYATVRERPDAYIVPNDPSQQTQTVEGLWRVPRLVYPSQKAKECSDSSLIPSPTCSQQATGVESLL